MVTVPQKHRAPRASHQTSHHNDSSSARFSWLILLSIAKDRDLVGNRHKGIDARWWTVLGSLSVPWQMLLQKSSCPGRLLACFERQEGILLGKSTAKRPLLPSNSGIYLAQRIVMALDITTTVTYLDNTWIMFSSWLFIAVVRCEKAWDVLKQR